ncbi:hypothetical protein CSB45_03620 [candidate division KSB3 bacterium]|uniref:V-type ATP synthase subunit H n=1 Tax=candidate division KSB3 bacterium TaxID=2044937 RepID=A0A2G6E9B2_9BACT|nr:MAG: hypothetical protein CSB45_03620 [candidate division KSB3 bacterium]PIE29582.1 MAG: hypothetical protein CSA57_08215 [candidate division KSB3 bacterium]
MNILENMLQIETEAQKIVEDAQKEAGAIRKKARDDAAKLIADGKDRAREQLQQEIMQLEKEADVQRTRILNEAQQRREILEQGAEKQIEKAVQRVVNLLLDDCGGAQS